MQTFDLRTALLEHQRRIAVCRAEGVRFREPRVVEICDRLAERVTEMLRQVESPQDRPEGIPEQRTDTRE